MELRRRRTADGGLEHVLALRLERPQSSDHALQLRLLVLERTNVRLEPLLLCGERGERLLVERELGLLALDPPFDPSPAPEGWLKRGVGVEPVVLAPLDLAAAALLLPLVAEPRGLRVPLRQADRAQLVGGRSERGICVG
eukprot:scaffold95110_cov28-Tisochrysis_lutea.AAC.1